MNTTGPIRILSVDDHPMLREGIAAVLASEKDITSAALFFLGPGAYSVDARLFGLRVTVVPPRKDKNSATTLN